MILTIEREWSKYPGWFMSLEREQQIDLLALHRVETTKAAALAG